MDRAEAAVRLYVRLRGQLAAIRSLPPGERHERDADACQRCETPLPTWQPGQRRKTCPKCRRAWPRIVTFEGVRSGGRMRAPKTGALDLYAELGRCLQDLTLWEERILRLYSLWPGSGRRLPAVTAKARILWPRRRGGWTRRGVEQILRTASQKLCERLDRAQLLEDV